MWALGAVALLGSEWLVVRDATWRAVAYAVTAAVLGLLSRPLREQRLWLAGWIVACGTGIRHDRRARRGLGARRRRADALRDRRPRDRRRRSRSICALAWGDRARRDLVTVAWATAILSLIFGEAFLARRRAGDRVRRRADRWRRRPPGRPAARGAAVVGRRRRRLGDEPRRALPGDASVALRHAPPPTPAEGLWVAIGCVARRSGAPIRGPGVPALDRPDRRHRRALRPVARDPRSRRAHVRRLDRDRLRARARRGERRLDADRARRSWSPA